MRLPSTGALIVVAAGLVGCVTVPVGPAVPVLPGANKGPGEFGADDASCRSYAQAATAGAAQAATDNAAASAAAGTVLGGLTGALIGAAVGDAGAGAAIGAGTGLLWGGAASAPGYASYDLQRRYDAYYVQCMVARGNLPPWRATLPGPDLSATEHAAAPRPGPGCRRDAAAERSAARQLSAAGHAGAGWNRRRRAGAHRACAGQPAAQGSSARGTIAGHAGPDLLSMSASPARRACGNRGAQHRAPSSPGAGKTFPLASQYHRSRHRRRGHRRLAVARGEG